MYLVYNWQRCPFDAGPLRTTGVSRSGSSQSSPHWFHSTSPALHILSPYELKYQTSRCNPTTANSWLWLIFDASQSQSLAGYVSIPYLMLDCLGRRSLHQWARIELWNPSTPVFPLNGHSWSPCSPCPIRCAIANLWKIIRIFPISAPALANFQVWYVLPWAWDNTFFRKSWILSSVDTRIVSPYCCWFWNDSAG